LWDTVHCIRFCYGVGYNGRKTPALWDTTEKFVTHPEIFFLQQKKLLPLYPTTEENLLHCIPQRKKNYSVVSHNGIKPFLLYPTAAKKLKTQITFGKINLPAK
jgi:hypothetical protein